MPLKSKGLTREGRDIGSKNTADRSSKVILSDKNVFYSFFVGWSHSMGDKSGVGEFRYFLNFCKK